MEIVSILPGNTVLFKCGELLCATFELQLTLDLPGICGQCLRICDRKLNRVQLQRLCCRDRLRQAPPTRCCPRRSPAKPATLGQCQPSRRANSLFAPTHSVKRAASSEEGGDSDDESSAAAGDEDSAFEQEEERALADMWKSGRRLLKNVTPERVWFKYRDKLPFRYFQNISRTMSVLASR